MSHLGLNPGIRRASHETTVFQPKRKAFTLVELLVVIAVIALLMGLLMPALAYHRSGHG